MKTQTHAYYDISQLRIVRSGLHLVTYLDVGNFCDKSTETTLHQFVCKFFLDFPIPASQANLYELAWIAGIRKSEENYPKLHVRLLL